MGNSYTSVETQYTNIKLLIGLKENVRLKELNAILQCLFHIVPLTNYIKYKFDKIEDIESYKSFHKKKICLTDSLKDLMDKVWPKDLKGKRDDSLKTVSKTEDSKDFLETIYKIDPNYNENQEFLINFIIMRLHKELNRIQYLGEECVKSNLKDKNAAFKIFRDDFLKKHQSKISDYCFGTYYTRTYCFNCKNNFYTFQPYIYGVYALDQVYNYKCQTINNGSNVLYMNRIFNIYEINVHDCLYYDKQLKCNMLTCEHCKFMTQSSFKNVIYLSPRILIFIFNQNVMLSNKRYIIEEKIDIDYFVEKKGYTKYFLVGMVFSIAFQKNYIAYCRSPIDNKWYCYNDSQVQMKNSFQEIIMAHGIPYILFYQLSSHING